MALNHVLKNSDVGGGGVSATAAADDDADTAGAGSLVWMPATRRRRSKMAVGWARFLRMRFPCPAGIGIGTADGNAFALQTKRESCSH